MSNETASGFWIASGNAQKAKELVDFSKKFLQRLGPVYVRGPKGVDENDKTFVGNARLKARALAKELIQEGQNNFWVLGDDSGLTVDLLQGQPGVRSARYAGEESTPEKNLTKLLQDLNAISLAVRKRTGAYHCALVLLQVIGGEIKNEYSSLGSRAGLLALSATGENGYAYDPVFLDPQTLTSYGEMSYEEKQQDSHRHRAFSKLNQLLG